MSGIPPTQFLRSTVVAGDVHELGASGTAASVATKASYASAGTGNRRFVPEVSSSADAAVPGAAPIGWEQLAAVSPDPVAFAGGTWTVHLNVLCDTAAVTGQLAVYVYVRSSNGTSVLAGNAMTALGTLPTALTVMSVPVTVAAFTTGPNPKLFVEAYALVTVGGVNLNGVNISLQTGGVDSRLADLTSFSVRASRTSTDVISRPVDTAVRAAAYFRLSAEALPRPLDTSRRETQAARVSSDIVPKLLDASARQTVTARLPLDTVPPPVDTSARVVTVARRAADILSSLLDSTTRAIAVARLPTDQIPTPTDSASRTALFPRRGADALGGPADTAVRIVLFPRGSSDALPRPADIAQRTVTVSRVSSDELRVLQEAAARLFTAGRRVDYQFQPGDEPLLDPVKSISGVIRDVNGTPYLGGAFIVLYRADNDTPVSSTTSSTVTGGYSFPRNSYDLRKYYVAAFAEQDSLSPLEAVSERNLTVL